MVTLNLTLVVELVLFLLFLWGTHAFILNPTVKNLDDREEMVEGDLQQARVDTQEAEKLEATYQQETGRIYREADAAYREAFRKANQDHLEFLSSEREIADQAVAVVRQSAQAEADEARPALLETKPEIQALMAQSILGQNQSGGQR